MSDRTKILLLLTPALSIIILLFFGGLFIGLLRSFNYMPIIGLTEPNLNAYLKTAKMLQLNPEECVMVACHSFDLNAAIFPISNMRHVLLRP